ncbi:thiamine diphosphokinase [Desulfomicrobium baculatum]|uniref:Thiamine diphosphokinase n=1 Tax=Desulfomicrobium baculatum (strain DSM 4028 / VKM B-1378 / X) TaxID=525897 RepID=C7LQ11_DESBD|nr:thiamine diphosphokinase [Desulfomicrobium baculatum]ACU91493.1 thiamine pyrophosphokinase [Desulfomicrobium baculatum DSM 4028]
MHWVLLANGPLTLSPVIRQVISTAERLIGVDGGSRHLRAMGMLPHLAVGDMDSISEELLQEYRQADVELHLHPPKKDATDLELALELALTRGASRISILGGTGGRLDHTLGNIFLLSRCLPAGIPACIMDQEQCVHLTDQSLTLSGAVGDTLSLLPATPEASGVSLTGLEYPLQDATLTFGTSWGMSNVFVETQATVTLRSGRLFVFHLFRS